MLNSRLCQSLYKEFEKAWFVQAFFFCVFVVLTGCVMSPEERVSSAGAYASDHGYRSHTIRTHDFSLYSAAPDSPLISSDGLLSIVIEGDGYAWVRSHKISNDSTPLDPVGLKLAVKDQAIYIARPCQFVSNERCGPVYWTAGRYRPEVFASYMEALDQLKAHYGARGFKITGYSGGGYIALNLAAMREDIRGVVSVAGLLDPNAWTDELGVSRLDIRHTNEALIQGSASTVFTHYCGSDDKVIPCALAYDFSSLAKRYGHDNHKVIEIEDADHADIWQSIP